MNLEQMWSKSKVVRGGSAKNVRRKIGTKMHNGGWLSNDVRDVIKLKHKAYMLTLYNKDAETRRSVNPYMDIMKEAKILIIRSKGKANKKFGRKMNDNLNGNNEWVWREMRKARNQQKNTCTNIKDVSGRVLVNDDDKGKMERIFR